MNINDLRDRQRTEERLAADAVCPERRKAHQEMADQYARLITVERSLFVPFSSGREDMAKG